MKHEQKTPTRDWEGPVTVEDIELAASQLRSTGASLVAMTTAAIAERIGRTAAAWLDDGSPYMEQAATLGTVHSGFSPEMIRWSLTELMRRLTPRSLMALVEAELGSVEPFQAPRSHGSEPCQITGNPPGLITQVLAGTVPPVGVEAIVLALLARGPLLLKTASEEPVISRLFLASLREHAPDLASHVAIMTWKGGETMLDRAACRAADIVAAYGGDESVNALLSHCQFPTRFYGYGHRVSFAVIGPGAYGGPASLDQAVEDVALDACAYDQRGCMSPHCVFVSREAPWSPEEFAKRLFEHGFPTVAARIPRGRIPDDTAAAIQQARGVAEFTAAACYWTDTCLVILQAETNFVPSPGGRSIHVVPYDSAESLLAAIRPLEGAISTVGLAIDSRRQPGITSALGRLGARRISRIGRMQRPIWLRHHDGRPRIGDWIDWTDVEPLYQ
ncbi:MAG: hypothetical protein ACJAYU_001264 [Bradymonadia bacterium]